ncbi:MAG: pyridoxal-phosphate dependent enzyme [Alphaproteobacteria bacterium]|jgi:cystathionine beta-synthase|nr:pyridoxal-phosphate dependent enzyme [Alphaproteobacteria bacterium]MBU2042440.1 pyridoxal-phosphate dependent enzyme [Alphaproteobacteria bacterium]MBU2126332.1 pyridoxal-phosphate dependent enzyme [Alphaproteobacteria bacterium]MBU2207294.1 pyridoxal-phosphate dependent enzyme [Alphaproteobacteria bacterium]MBU2291109.1 pyridoxal-phosphate dependent enzyme [Alphaproteobacteria bacterium]
MSLAAAPVLSGPTGSLLDLIGKTPMVEVTKIDTGPCRLFLKLEAQNPGGSIKDRIALSMIAAAEAEGFLKPGGTIVEATAGNTGLALTLVGQAKGYKVLLVIPDKMSKEKIQHLRAMGADVRLTRSDVPHGHPEYYTDMAERLAQQIPGGFYVNQFANDANSLAHFQTTGPEIWEQMDHKVDAFVAGIGSGGTITGIGQYLKSVGSEAKIILADPVGSTLAGIVNDGVPGPEGSYTVEGIGQNFVPDTANMDLIDTAYSIPDAEAVATVRELLLKEGILAGSSSGTLIASALRWCREQTEPKRVVTFVCDTGAKYLSKVYNDAWLADQGLGDQPLHGDLSDLISRKYEKGDVVVAGPDDTLDTAFKRMRGADVSQLPIIQDGRLVGILDESDIVHVMNTDEITRQERFKKPVGTVMTRDLDTVQVGESLDALIPLFDRDRVAIVLDGETFVGLITRTDLINHLSLNR